MYKKITIVCSIIAVIFCSCMCTGCTTTRTKVNSDILEYQREIDALEDTVRGYEDAVTRAITELDYIGSRASSMEATIDELIELFGQYQCVVEQLIRDYNKVREEAAKRDTSAYNSYNIDIVTVINNYNRLYIICKKYKSV